MIALLTLMPMLATAQDNTWERVEQAPVEKTNPDAKYLEPNAVPVVDGKVSLGRLAETAFSTDPFSDPECVSCAAFPICGGGCPIDRIKAAGKPPKPYCSYHRQYLADMLPLFYERQKKH